MSDFVPYAMETGKKYKEKVFTTAGWVSAITSLGGSAIIIIDLIAHFVMA